MSADHDELRRLLGGYLLGGLDESDTDRLDAHLVTCDECRATLDRLGPVPELLRALPQTPVADLPQAPVVTVAPGARPSADRIAGLLSRMRAERARDRRRSTVRRLAVAAAVLLVAAITGALVISRDDDRPPVPQAAASPAASQPQRTVLFEAAAGSGLTGQAVLTGKTWGVSVDLVVQKLAGQGPFVCQVRNGDGRVEQAAMWGPTPTGNARVTGASSIQLGNVRIVSVTDSAGHLLGTAHLD
ncbi:zf-HC2 domain-containing protein [Actinoplanes sp. NPDC051494]|uniref:zf-HC2 domain-containing protein n=1 Tax=Actinoplanes sp. NPDC051494 TaxID=3363907 RepID=UPI0037994E7A